MYSLGMNIWYLFMHKKCCGYHVTKQIKYNMYVGTS